MYIFASPGGKKKNSYQCIKVVAKNMVFYLYTKIDNEKHLLHSRGWGRVEKSVPSWRHTSPVTTGMCSGLWSFFLIAVKSPWLETLLFLSVSPTEMLLNPNSTAALSPVGSLFSKMMPYVCLNATLKDVSILGIPLNDPYVTLANVYPTSASNYFHLAVLYFTHFFSLSSMFTVFWVVMWLPSMEG